jgi:hypothetical protein
MDDHSIPIGKSQSIRSCGLDEYWLQDQIVDNPGCLELGELEVVYRERTQSAGGRLDILLKNPEDDSMYEVEVMLGETDEKHIIHTIEYWDNEKRKWPQRQHFAVLVAESITRRFYNVIQLLSHAIPIIAVQVNIVEADGKRILHFSKVLDTYEEPEEVADAGREYNEEFWREKSPWTLETARAVLDAARPSLPDASLNFVKNYIAIVVNGNNYIWLHKRSSPRSLLGFWVTEEHFVDATQLLDKAALPYLKKSNNQTLRIAVDKATIVANAATIEALANLVKKSWEN